MEAYLLYQRLSILSQRWNFSEETLALYKRLLARLKRDILQPQTIPVTDQDEAPPALPTAIATFVSMALDISLEGIDEMWQVLKDTIWDMDPGRPTKEELGLFRHYGWPLGIVAYTLYPPNIHCINHDCTRTNPLKRELSMSSVLAFTKDDGVQAAYEVVTYCPDCNTSYHHNYSVQDKTRRYYEAMPEFIQVGEHQFVHVPVIRLWITQMLFGWYSFSNAAASYSAAFNNDEESYDRRFWRLSPELRQEHASDGFFILSLLEDCRRRGFVLEVPHSGDQSKRFQAALEARNEWIILNGQPDAVRHACDKCMRVYRDLDGSYSTCTPSTRRERYDSH
ncbi:hypothetical protein CC2G_002248 [Coprinopsis cinerea AmutBmut pab1-1]|nr:hypothetical protein CC2G_002248 [Coprinopsis cinerea AmutBmut pab1-1]